LEKLGYDQVRSRIRVRLKNGKVIEGRYDVARGHPEKPMNWAELSDKFRDCASLVMADRDAEKTIQLVTHIDELKSLGPLYRALTPGQPKATRKLKTAKRSEKQRVQPVRRKRS
jgi:2-methylcitrate dehydratase PrpD